MKEKGALKQNKVSKNDLEYQKIKFSFDAVVCGLVTKDALVMPCSFVSNDTSAHFSFKVILSSSHRTKQTKSNLCHNLKNDSLLTKLIKLEAISSIAGIF